MKKMRLLPALAAALTLALTGLTINATDQSTLPWDPVATFSILGFDPETGEAGGVVQSRVFSVGNGVLWAEADVGVAATQAIVDVSYGPQALALLKQGMNPAEVVKTIWERDPDPRPDAWSKYGRQFAVMDAKGNVAAYTGPKATSWAGHKYGQYCSAQGNILAGEAVVANMVKTFETTTGHLSLRLMAALEAGQAAGGDTRGMQSAAMLIVKKGGGVWLNNDVVLRLQVDDSQDPFKELRRLVTIAAEQRARRPQPRLYRLPPSNSARSHVSGSIATATGAASSGIATERDGPASSIVSMRRVPSASVMPRSRSTLNGLPGCV